MAAERGASRRTAESEPDRPRLVAATRMAAGFVGRAARGEFVWSLVAEVVGAVGLAGVLLLGRRLVTELTADGGVDELGDVLPETVGLGVCLIVSGLTTVLVRQLRWLVAERVTRLVELEIVAVASTVDYERYEQQEFHDQLNRAHAQASESSYELVYGLLSLFNVLVTSLAVVAVLVTSVPEVLGVLLLIVLPSVAAARMSARLAYRTTYELTPDDRLRSYLFGALTGKREARELRVFGLARVLRPRWDGLYDERMRRLRHLVGRQVLFNGLAALVGALLVAGVLLVLVQAAIDGSITLGDAAVAIVALQQLSTRFRSAASTSGSLSESAFFLNEFDRFRQLRGEDVVTAPPATMAPRPTGRLVVEHVSFRYPGTEPLVLDDVSLEITPGEIVALVGLSGGGKTTLAHLVAGLYQPIRGRISFAGQDIATPPVADHWRSVAAVFQDFARYELTAHENVAMSDHDRIDDASGVRGAASQAGIAGALERLPSGYRTMLSRAYDGGADLSVGQWQRVAVARAFFRDAPLLILDEPAAALDAVAEQQLYERLVELCRDRSVLLISHRFSTVRMADRICVLQEGRIVEQGTHRELLDRAGLYAELFRLQASGYLADEIPTPAPAPGAGSAGSDGRNGSRG